MDTLIDVLRTLNLVFGMAATGGAIYEAFVVVPRARTLGSAAATDVLRSLRLSPHTRVYRYLPASGVVSGVAGLVVAVLWNEQPRSAAILTALGFVLFVGALILNLLYWGAAEKRVYRLTTPADDSTLAMLSARNVGRALCYAVGFVLFVVAAVID
jgi:hypothetical protein